MVALAGRDRLVDIVPCFSRFDLSALTPSWWDANVHSAASKLVATCRETILLKWLHQTFGEESVEFQIQGCINPQTGRQLPFDYGITAFGASRLILLELDGTIGHFGKDFHDNETRDYALRDLFKERWALSQGHSVVRVLQMDVWHNRSDWQTYLKQSVSAASASSTPKVFCPEDAVEYTSGIYAELRAADPGL